MRLDIAFINPGDRRQVFQDLGKDYSGIEPPFWVAVLAAYLRKKGYSVAIIDANAENLSPEETARRVAELRPLLTSVVVYGSQPSASTQNMTIAGRICSAIRESLADTKVALGGLHPSALPERTMREEAVEFVVDGEGFHTFTALMDALKNGSERYGGIPGLWWRDGGEIRGNKRAQIIEDLDAVLPVPAWDLLPMHLYRAHNWHCFDNIEERSPYGAIYTSLGCPYSCIFCCINAPFGKPGIRYRSPERVVEEIGVLVTRYGVKNLKIVDELFVLKDSHYMGIAEGIIRNGYKVNIWAYARVDTVNPANLARMKQAGVNWLALGIESANPDVRDGAQKRMKVKEVRDVVRIIQDAGIRVIGNFIFGLPDDTVDTMQETLDMAIDLNCEFANFYSAMAYPGSALYDISIKEGWPLPDSWHGFSQHSYECMPLPTKHISAAEVLKFRDEAFHRYFENSRYLDMIEMKFGPSVKRHVQDMCSVRLKRILLGN